MKTNEIRSFKDGKYNKVIITNNKEKKIINKSEVDPKIFLEGKIEGTRGQGRPRVTWMKNFKERLGHTYNGCVRRAEKRNSWRSMIADLLLVDGT